MFAVKHGRCRQGVLEAEALELSPKRAHAFPAVISIVGSLRRPPDDRCRSRDRSLPSTVSKPMYSLYLPAVHKPAVGALPRTNNRRGDSCENCLRKNSTNDTKASKRAALDHARSKPGEM